MLTSRIAPLATMAAPSIKPYAVMDFDSLIATALSGNYYDHEVANMSGQYRDNQHSVQHQDTSPSDQHSHRRGSSAGHFIERQISSSENVKLQMMSSGHSNVSLSTSWKFQDQKQHFVASSYCHLDSPSIDSLSGQTLSSHKLPVHDHCQPDINSNYPSPEIPPRLPLPSWSGSTHSTPAPFDTQNSHIRGRLMSVPLLDDDERPSIKPDLNSSLPIIDIDFDNSHSDQPFLQPKRQPHNSIQSRSPFTSTMVPFPASWQTPSPNNSVITPPKHSDPQSLISEHSITSRVAVFSHTPVSEHSITPRGDQLSSLTPMQGSVASIPSLQGFPPSTNVRSPLARSPGQTSEGSVGSIPGVSGPVVMNAMHMKPGPNLIKPIAYKPGNSPARSPIGVRCGISPAGQAGRRPHGSGEESVGGASDRGGANEMPRQVTVRLGTSMLGLHASPDPHASKVNHNGRGAFINTTRTNGGLGYNSNNNNNNNNNSSSESSHPSQLHQSNNAQCNHSNLDSSGHSYHNMSSSSQLNMSLGSQNNMSVNSQHNMSANSSHLSGHLSERLSGNSSHISVNSSRLSGADDASLCGENRPDSIPSLGVSRLWQQGAEPMLQTPSPSDSGVGELEQMLREKDAEMNILREVMDRNERAIIQCYEERRHVWAQDSQELRDDYERQIKVNSRKSYKTEQVLSLQVYKLQQEHKTLHDEKARVVSENDTFRRELEESRAEITRLKAQNDKSRSSPQESSSLDTLTGDSSERNNSSDSVNQEDSVMKNKEIIRLKSDMHVLKSEIDNKNREILERARDTSSKNDQISKMKDEISRLQNPVLLKESSSQTHVPSEVSVSENVKPSALGERDRAIGYLREEVNDVKSELEFLKCEQEKEREQWSEEKNKVVRYQKQLQLNYVQMQRKNGGLEKEVQQLTLELENRDMKLIALSGEESVC